MNSQIPQRVLLCSGHMIDHRDRVAKTGSARFPPACEPAVAKAIRTVLDELSIASRDLGVTQGACGADLLFAEAMLERGASVQLLLPTAEPEFLRDSVAFPKPPGTPDRWAERFREVCGHVRTQVVLMSPERAVGEPEDIYERCNERMLASALSFGADRLHFVCVWNGQGGDGPGGTQHMRHQILEKGGFEHWIDVRGLCRA